MKRGQLLRLYYKVYICILRFVAKFLPRRVKNAISKFYTPKNFIDYTIDYGESFIPQKSLDFLLSLISKCIYEDLPGDLIECGVFKGGSTIQIGQRLKELNSNKHLHAIDTFEGHPFDSKEDITKKGELLHHKGRYSNVEYNKVRDLVSQKKLNNIKLYKGSFDEVFPSLRDKTFCFAHVDADIYLSVKQCIIFLIDRMAPEGIIYFDDYNAQSCPGATKAVDELLDKSSITVLPHCQCYWINKLDNNRKG